jgi:zinc protease
MRKVLLSAALLLAGTALAAPPAATELPVQIPFSAYTLKNGLRLVVHEDHKAPIVAVNVWYHVGSKNEKPGRTGFAHLFEHLMFNGSENFDDDWFKAMDRVGATNLNGTTSFDRTNYFQNVPVSALDTVLWLESDRMGHLIGAIDQAKLDEQRGVVQNEKRQGENQPYGQVWNQVFENVFPAGHPYSWSVIGKMEDLQAAKLEDVHEWFKTYYGAANAVVVVAGDVDPETVRAKVERYFGDIPSGPPVARQQAWVPKLVGEHRQRLEDRVPQARVYKVWTAPQYGADDVELLDLAANALGGGKNSRLYQRLVYRDKIATDVATFNYTLEAAGVFAIQVTAQPGGDLAAVERAVDEELARFLSKGPTKAELDRERTGLRAAFVRGVERIGGFGGKSDVLAESTVYGGSPDAWQAGQRRLQRATVADVRSAAQRWLGPDRYVLQVVPFAQYATVPSTVDRKAMPMPDGFPSGRFPERETATLSNGLPVVLVHNAAVPVVDMSLVFDAGYAADRQAGGAGTANLAMAMLDEGTATRTSLQISEQLARLGAELSAGSDLDSSYLSLSALRENLAPSLDLLADVLLNPSFPGDDFERLRKQVLAGIQRERATPGSIASRLMPKLMYGADHPYGAPLTGSGELESVGAMTREQLVAFHDVWLRPNNATLVVVGDTTLAELKPLLEQRLAGWKPGTVPQKALATVAQQPKPVIWLVDRPDSLQSVILAGTVAPPKSSPDDVAIEAMNQVLGGSFTARINMNLREDKHWSYGSRSQLIDARGQRPFVVTAPVQTDKTAEAIAEVMKELTGIIGARPIGEAELANAKDKRVLTLPGRWETGGAVLNDLIAQLKFGLPADTWATYAEWVRALDLASVDRAAREVVRPGNLIWVVVGDRKKIEAPIRKLGLAEVRVVDADGRPVAD